MKTDGAFRSLANRDYRILWWGGLFSFMSVQMQFLLRGILAFDLTGRDDAQGLVYFAFGLSMLVATPLGGVASDRFSKRLVLLISQFGMLSAASIMGVLVLAGREEFWMLVIGGAVQGAAFGFFGPARVAFSAELVGRAQVGNAITLSLLSMNGTRIFAPALAGALAGVAFFGIGGAYLLSAVFAAASFWHLSRLPEKPATTPTGGNPIREILDGISYVRADPALRRIVVTSFFVIMFGFNYVVFLPPFVLDTLGLEKVWVGVISSASAIGAVAVSVPLAARADSPAARTVMQVSGVVFGFTVLAISISPSFWIAFAVIMIVGAATTIYQSLSNTLALGRSSQQMAGRVQSLMQLSFAGFGLAALPLGAFSERAGRRPAIALMGAVTVVAMMIYIALEARASRAAKPEHLRSGPTPLQSRS